MCSPEKIWNLSFSNCWKCIEIVNPTITTLFFVTIPPGRPFGLLRAPSPPHAHTPPPAPDYRPGKYNAHVEGAKETIPATRLKGVHMLVHTQDTKLYSTTRAWLYRPRTCATPHSRVMSLTVSATRDLGVENLCIAKLSLACNELECQCHVRFTRWEFVHS